MKQAMFDAWMQDFNREAYLCEVHEWCVLYAHAKGVLKNIDNWAKDKSIDTEIYLMPNTAAVRYEPLGVACIFGTWNFPFTLVFRPMVEAIAAGNCVVIRPSEMAPACA